MAVALIPGTVQMYGKSERKEGGERERERERCLGCNDSLFSEVLAVVMMRCSVTRALFKTILLSCNKLYYI
jgi:hypothetical protein